MHSLESTENLYTFLPGMNEEENEYLIKKLKEKFPNSFRVLREDLPGLLIEEPILMKGSKIFKGSLNINSFIEGF